MKVRLIACIDQDNGIGFKNKLLYRLKDDLKRFSRLTKGNVVVMGRKTLESLPDGPLKDRSNFVISTTLKPSKGIVVYRSYNDFFMGGQYHSDIQGKEIFVIGGGEIYSEMIKHAHQLDITHVRGAKKADTHFPEIDPMVWKVVKSGEEITEGDVSYRYVTYKRINPL